MSKKDSTTSDPERRLYAYELHQAADMRLSTAPVDRAWMEAAPQRAPYRCLPLAIANQAGWWIPCPVTFTATWDGGLDKANLQLDFNPPPVSQGLSALFAPIMVSADLPNAAIQNDPRVSSHFGNGIVTFSIPYLFRTPPGINLWVKGPVNYFKDGIQALEGIVETDWLSSTFTMNWKLTRPHYSARFERGEPICMIVPIPRGLAEQLEPVYVPLDSNPELAGEYREWEKSRDVFNRELGLLKPEAVQRGWQRDYMKGRTIRGQAAKEHQTRLQLREFRQKEGDAPSAG
jgi:hypothetical protein